MIYTTNAIKALVKIQKEFRLFLKTRSLDDYQFPFDNNQWRVIHKPSGRTWSVHDTAIGFNFKVVNEGDGSFATKKPLKRDQPRGRPRAGYVMIELSADERAKLERLVDARNAKSFERGNMSSTVRELIREAIEPK